MIRQRYCMRYRSVPRSLRVLYRFCAPHRSWPQHHLPPRQVAPQRQGHSARMQRTPAAAIFECICMHPCSGTSEPAEGQLAHHHFPIGCHPNFGGPSAEHSQLPQVAVAARHTEHYERDSALQPVGFACIAQLSATGVDGLGHDTGSTRECVATYLKAGTSQMPDTCIHRHTQAETDRETATHRDTAVQLPQTYSKQ